MNRLLILIITFPFLSFGQKTKFPTNKDLKKIYTQAIADFIQDVNKNKRLSIDTLFVRKRTNEEESTENFPDIQLPESIEKVNVRLVSPAIGDIQQKALKNRICINMFGWIDNPKIKFDIIVFSNGFDNKFNYYIEYNYNPQAKKYELIELKFQGSPFDK